MKVAPVHPFELSTITKHKSKTNYRLSKVRLPTSVAPLSLIASLGDVFTKLEDEDDQGWCKGRVGNRIGLYPATYVESV